ncbi:DNA polymerase family B PolB2 [Methanobrevibacter ruminantium M1]|uniref:DNA-directed DNA polymerase n=1 Tax=Methanobrevibacter ruminantium (strain ATCC 35063 / DSM 1093 / JCM 13430 / OCM 146 / M1) TaxID=634498 RepID=D3E4E2_METRM|nr:DNA polymerase domain-containing protein [Methanobrevibacter ruminantium]ADC47403.1 DNA polymerase family B PolB2 [Methanobrevibacter ruminantium M1]
MPESPEQLAIEKEIQIQKDKFLNFFNGELPDTMELEFEGFYRRGFFVSKKRYAVIENEKIIAKGLELVRRDWAPIAKKTQEEILMAILKEGDVKKAEKIISKVLRKIKSGDIATKDLIIHTQITKNLDDYKQIGPHVIAAREIEAHGIKVGKGTIVQYIISKGKGSISQRAVPYEYSEGVEYDKEYYIENQLIPAVSRMMEPLGYDKNRLRELASTERQQSLDAFF